MVDTISKIWARTYLAAQPRHLEGPLWLRLQFNSGVSFSINHSNPLITTAVTAIVAVVVLVVALRARAGAPAVGFGFLLGGGGANVLDRILARPHRVTDFIAFGSFPVFNVADVAVTFGFIVLVLATIRGEKLLTR